MRRFTLFALVLVSAASMSAQQETPQVPPSSRTVGYEQYAPSPEPAYTASQSERPNDLQVLTSKPETSVPAADRASERFGYAYGAPYAYPGLDGGMYGYTGRPTFLYRRRVPLFGSGALNPFPSGFVPRAHPMRPFSPKAF